MQKVTFIFTMNFLRSFKDDNYIYFLLEFVKGMELFDVIRDMGKKIKQIIIFTIIKGLLTVSDSQFYIGSLILTLEYLNSHQIIYRDIKPENLMVDHQVKIKNLIYIIIIKGYLKMIDMGTAKILNNSNGPARTFTIIGTPHYMAPEIISGKGYSFPVDLWSIGIMLFEFVCGYLPFGEEAEDPFEIYQIILKTSVIFPGFFKDKNSKKIIIQLLNKIPDARLGGGSFAALKANSWFDKFDWVIYIFNNKILLLFF